MITIHKPVPLLIFQDEVFTLQELAPSLPLKEMGLPRHHRASPSAALDKKNKDFQFFI
ncbi:hypothetical protein SAMN05444972_106215 [Marininema halotolerans]|uniref:Uncharacterized protein n=1 Tax=Marininema halotolerans TaxID=1155944 RepID=A0A1I6S8B6_9BACL|nr:hypothetical protein SAMN05444972_106215 [Marininema halotolerans]